MPVDASKKFREMVYRVRQAVSIIYENWENFQKDTTRSNQLNLLGRIIDKCCKIANVGVSSAESSDCLLNSNPDQFKFSLDQRFNLLFNTNITSDVDLNEIRDLLDKYEQQYSVWIPDVNERVQILENQILAIGNILENRFAEHSRDELIRIIFRGQNLTKREENDEKK